MTIPDNDHDRIIYMRKAFDATCQRLTDKGFFSDEVTLTMFSFSIAIMYKYFGFDSTIDVLTNALSTLRADHKASTQEYKH